jgi:phenylacetate-CoA ligase
MPRFTPMGAGVLPADERHPLLPDAGRHTLTTLLESPDAPLWNHQCGDRLDRDGLNCVAAFASLIRTEPPSWRRGTQPGWLAAYLDRVRTSVPRYRRGEATAPTFTTSRQDLARAHGGSSSPTTPTSKTSSGSRHPGPVTRQSPSRRIPSPCPATTRCSSKR